TNNSLERFNRTIKDKYVGWKRNGILKFLQIASEIVKDQSEKTIKKYSDTMFNILDYFSTSFINTIGFDFIPLDSVNLWNRFVILTSDSSNINIEELKGDFELIKSNNFLNFRELKRITSQF
ncbi:hypothetical protein H311_00933, partial [Anncaliia algerae PRA109]